MPNLLFVCSSNRTRGPLAAALFDHYAKEGGLLDWQVDSAGLRAQRGQRIDPKVAAVLSSRGLHPLRMGTQAINAKLIKMADLILVMTRDQERELTKRFVSARNKTKTLMSILRQPKDIFDPNKGDQERFELCATMMEPALQRLVERLQ